MANTSIPINTNPTSDPQYTGGEVVLPSDDSVIDINPINENAEALAKAVNQLFWDVNQGDGGSSGDAQQIENIKNAVGIDNNGNITYASRTLSEEVSGNASNISSLNNQVSELNSTTDGLSSDLTNLTDRVVTAESHITTANTNIGNANTQIDSIKSAVGIDNDGSITYANGTLSKKVSDNAASISATNTKIGNKSDTSSVDTVYGYVNGIKDIVNANTATLQTLGGGTVPTQSLTTIVDSAINAALVGYTPTIQPGQITSSELSTGAVTSTKIGDKEVKTANIDDGAVGSAQLASDSVGTTNIVDGAVTLSKLEVSIQYAISAMQSFIGISEKGTYSYTNPGGTVSCDVAYTIFRDNSVEIYIKGTDTGVIRSEITATEPTVQINLTELGINAPQVSFASARIEFGEMTIRDADLTKPIKSVGCSLSRLSDVLNLDYSFYLEGTSTAIKYGIVSFEARICGANITVQDPNS